MPRQRPTAVWVGVDPEQVPNAWRDRAVTVAMLPLLPEEAERVLDALAPAAPEEPDFLALLAEGASPNAIGRALNLSVRSVHRRASRLKERIGVSSSAELAAELARRGFASGRKMPDDPEGRSKSPSKD